MPKLWLVCLLLFVSSKAGFCQADARLDSVAAALPAGWTMNLTGQQLIFLRGQPITILFENRINAPLSTESLQQRSERIRRLGRQTECRLVFALQAKWTEQRWAEAEHQNADIQRALQALPDKHQIADLYDKRLSRKGTPTYLAHSQEESARIKAYEDERSELLGQLLPVPDYSSSCYSLFLSSQQGAEDELHLVDPPEASRELYLVRQQLAEQCSGR